MTSRHRRTFVALVLVAALAVVAGAGAACSAQASGEAATSPGANAAATSATATADGASGSAASTAKGGADDDWTRITKALAWMRSVKPAKPVVVLLGGSAARECTNSDKSWRDQIVANGGPETLAWNMGSRNRTMSQNLAIVKALPKEVPAVVFIGINLGAFASAQRPSTITLPSTAPTAEPSLQQPHQYGIDKTGILSPSRKKALLSEWLVKRSPVFKANFTSNASTLIKIITLCKSRGYTPALLELPRDTAIIGSALNAPTTKFRSKCKQLAARYHVAWIPLMATMPNRDFYDLWHLVEPGRDVWEPKLAAKTAALLR